MNDGIISVDYDTLFGVNEVKNYVWNIVKDRIKSYNPDENEKIDWIRFLSILFHSDQNNPIVASTEQFGIVKIKPDGGIAVDGGLISIDDDYIKNLIKNYITTNPDPEQPKISRDLLPIMGYGSETGIGSVAEQNQGLVVDENGYLSLDYSVIASKLSQPNPDDPNTPSALDYKVRELKLVNNVLQLL